MSFDVSSFYQMGLSAGNRLGGLTSNLNTGDKYIPDLLRIQNEQAMQQNQLKAALEMQQMGAKDTRKNTAITQSQENRRLKKQLEAQAAESEKQRKAQSAENALDRTSQESRSQDTVDKTLMAAMIAASKKGVTDPMTLARKDAESKTPRGFLSRHRQPSPAEIGASLGQVLGSMKSAISPTQPAAGGGVDLGRYILSSPVLSSAYSKLYQVRLAKGAVTADDLAQVLGNDIPAVLSELKNLGITNIDDVLAYINQ